MHINVCLDGGVAVKWGRKSCPIDASTSINLENQ